MSVITNANDPRIAIGKALGVNRKVPKIARPLARMVEEWGAECDEYEPGCACCEAWKLFNNSAMRLPSADEVMAAVRAATSEKE